MDICDSRPMSPGLEVQNLNSRIVRPSDTAEEANLAKYLTCTVCTRCFGFQIRKDPRFVLCSAPCLVVAGTKSPKKRGSRSNIFFKPQQTDFSPSTTVDAQTFFRTSINLTDLTNGAYSNQAINEADEKAKVESKNRVDGVSPPPTSTPNFSVYQKALAMQELSVKADVSNPSSATSSKMITVPKLAGLHGENPIQFVKESTVENSKDSNESTAGVEHFSGPYVTKPKWTVETHPISPSLKSGAPCYVTHIWGFPIIFTLQAAQDGDMVNELQESIAGYCAQAPPISRVPQPGEILFGLYNDEFYRCCVDGVGAGRSEVYVSFLDHGDTAKLKLSDCREPCDEIMAKHPIYGVMFECNIPIEYPSNFSLDNSIIESSLKGEVIMQIESEEVAGWLGRLEIPGSVSWNEILTNHILEANSRQAPSVSKFKSSSGTALTSKSPPVRTSNSASQGGQCSEKHDHISLRERASNPVGLKEFPTVLSMPLSKSLKNGARVHVNYFWHYRNLAVSAIEDDKKVLEMQASIQQHIQNAPKMVRVPVNDDVVLAPYGEEYYRAVVTKMDETGVHVRFIDYGDNAVVSQSELRELNEDLKRHPIYGLVVEMVGLPKNISPKLTVEELDTCSEGILDGLHQNKLDSWTCHLRVGGNKTWSDIVLNALKAFD